MTTKKIISLIIIIVMIVILGVVGILAYLTKDNTNNNTFTIGTVNISMDEVKVNENGEFIKVNEDGSESIVADKSEASRITDGSNVYKLIPGLEYVKDPIVTLHGGSVDTWIFITVAKSEDFEKYISYEINNIWTKLEGYPQTYYVEASASESDQTFNILKQDKIIVQSDITNETLSSDSFIPPNIEFKAYAVQKKGLPTAKDAWEDLQRN